MTTSLRQTLAQARAAWLAGDRDAWARYAACLRQFEAERSAGTDRRVWRRPRRHEAPGRRA